MTVDLMVATAKSFLFVLVTLLPILNPAATAPIFLSMTEGASPATRPFKLMLAKVENYGGKIVHLGLDYALSDKRTLFAEVYREADTAALFPRRGGQAIAVGLRHDF